MRYFSALKSLSLLASALLLGAHAISEAPQEAAAPAVDATAEEEPAVRVEFLEIVSADMEATCELLGAVHGVTFGEPVAAFGNARTAALSSGGRISVRAPLRADEAPVVRPYLLVDDIEAAVRTAAASGGEIAMPATEIPGQGRFAIYLLGGIQHGLWQH